MKAFWILFFMIIVTSCGSLPEHQPKRVPDKSSLADEVRRETFKQLKEEKDLHPFGISASMMDQIKLLGLGFQFYKEVDLDSARDLVMTAAELLLEKINANEQIRGYLESYPFKPNNISITIFFRKPNGSLLDPGGLSVAALSRGVLEYDIKTPDGLLSTFYQETFETAKAKLNEKAAI